MLNNESETKAVFASKTLSSLDNTKQVNDTKATFRVHIVFYYNPIHTKKSERERERNDRNDSVNK